MMVSNSPDIGGPLLIEDNDDHRTLVKAIFKKLDYGEIAAFGRAQEALAYLDDSETLLPRFILLDINLPGMSGLEFLKLVKHDEDLRSIPIIILSTSNAHADRQAAFAAYANSFLVKPIDFVEFKQVVEEVCRYWVDRNQVYC